MVTITTPITDADLALMRKIVGSSDVCYQQPSIRIQTRNRYRGEISNLTISREIGQKIGNIMFRTIANSIGIPVIEHGTHPYILMDDKGKFVDAFNHYSSSLWNA